ncbi:hypothetical protein [Sessilibacter corallicola]|uniref:hypothetical protein n=1 Tax=Sessilibacter corallicola TaxID=2904075 RepID=UPI001E5D10EC|nr:hypothetical protein [Sessilibacter corallicola]MCE2029454.1 hypothetical protein [Sessilibacter corallicola]
MGTWGTAIEENDVFADAYDCFFNTYNDGCTPEEAAAEVKVSLANSIENPDESIDVFFATVLALWETKSLPVSYVEEVRIIVDSGQDIDRWRSLEANDEQLENRQVHLEAFLSKISTPRSKKKIRSRKKFDWREEVMLELAAPDGNKVFRVIDCYVNGKYKCTSASMKWATGGNGIFQHHTEGAGIEGRWLNSQNLELVIHDSPYFSQQKIAFYLRGDQGEITYLTGDGQRIVPDKSLP